MPLKARKVPGAVSLGQGIPSIATPSYIRDAVSRMLETTTEIGKYSLQPGLPALKEEVAQIATAYRGQTVDAESEVFISAGAMEALFCAITALIDEGDEVILFDPGYASHIEQVLFAGGTPVFVSLQEEDGWGFDPDLLERSITAKTRAIIVCNPGNPTGKVFGKEDLQKISAIAADAGLTIIADETYDFLVYDDLPFHSMLGIAPADVPVVACYSFSKRFAMTGWRCGYMVAPPELISEALKVHDATVICAPTISQFAALAALREEHPEERDSLRTILQSRRNLICERLSALPDLFSFVRPEGAYYVLPRYLRSDERAIDLADRLLFEAGVITIPGSAFGPAGEGHIRMSFGGDESDINEAFDRLESWGKEQ